MYEENKYLTSRPYLPCCRHLLILKKKKTHFFFLQSWPGFTNNIFLLGSSVSFFSSYPLTDTNYNSQRRRMLRVECTGGRKRWWKSVGCVNSYALVEGSTNTKTTVWGNNLAICIRSLETNWICLKYVCMYSPDWKYRKQTVNHNEIRTSKLTLILL